MSEVIILLYITFSLLQLEKMLCFVLNVYRKVIFICTFYFKIIEGALCNMSLEGGFQVSWISKRRGFAPIVTMTGGWRVLNVIGERARLTAASRLWHLGQTRTTSLLVGWVARGPIW